MLTSKEYAALDCTKRKTEAISNLTVFEPGYMHQERNPVITWQTMDNTVYLFGIVTVFGNVILEFARLVDMKKIVGMVNESLVTDLLAIVVNEDVAHYGIYPTLEIGIGSIFVHVAQCLKRCFLQ